MKKTLIIIFSFVFLLSSCVASGDATVKSGGKKDNKIEYNVTGNSGLPFWSEMTDFEIKTLKNLDKARKGDPDTLLAFAVIASGNKRDLKSFINIKKRIRRVVEKLRPEFAKMKTFREKGNLLHQAMHKEFFLESKGPNPAGYSLNQSRLTDIFTTKKYNCISSAMLYMILVRYFNMNVKGVLLPTHAFVQIESPKGKIIEVETTSINGFGLEHNKKFYKTRAGKWSKSRGLRSTTYKDYQKRKISAPHLLIAANMNSQHTSPERMKPADRLRVSEIFAYTDPNDRIAQLNMLNGYNDQFNKLKSKKDFKTLEKLFGRTDVLITNLRKNRENDSEIQNIVSWLDYEYAYTLHQNGKHDSALKKQETGLRGLGNKIKDRAVLLKNQMALIHNYLIDLVEQKHFKSIEVISQRFSEYCNQVDWCKEDPGWFYNPWADVYWDRGEWDKVTEKLGMQLKLTQDKKIRTDVMKTLEKAYLNWCYTYMNQGKWSRAADILKKCLAKYPKMRSCQKTLEKLKHEHGV
jgi:tetratricopeptide (TPR) repeat protein